MAREEFSPFASGASRPAGLSRRRLLGVTGAAAAIAATGVLPKVIRDLLAVVPATPGSGTITDVKHVVMLMQENRSFDHYFGTMKGVRGFSDPTALRQVERNLPVFFQQCADHDDGWELPFNLVIAEETNGNGAGVEGPGMGRETDYGTWNQGRMDGYCPAHKGGSDQMQDIYPLGGGEVTELTHGMGYFTRNEMPFYHALADSFTIGDNYFQSTFTQTNPNRLVAVSGSNGLSVGEDSEMGNSGDEFTWDTYAEVLEVAGVSWKVYQEVANFDDNLIESFKTFMDAADAELGGPRGDDKDERDGPVTPGAGGWRFAKGIDWQEDLVEAFGDDVENDNLPQVSWIVTPSGVSEHATAHPPAGEDLTARLLQKLADNPDVAAKTVFILHYDEGGGFFDHVPPPTAPADGDGDSTVSLVGELWSDDDEMEPFGEVPIGPGFRVPIIVVSPWTRGGFVNSEVFDHTSVLRFLETWTTAIGKSARCDNISTWRRAVCGDLTSMFDFSSTDTTAPDLPDLTATAARVEAADDADEDEYLPRIPDLQALPWQEPGTRPARPLPYDLTVTTTVTPTKISVDFVNAGSVGASFHIYANTFPLDFRGDDVWRHTVSAGRTVNDYWSGGDPHGTYDYTVHGPNGFLRRFAGDYVKATTSGKANPEVALRYAPGSHRVYLDMKNSGTAACVITVRANRYRAGTYSGPWTYTLAPGASDDDYFNIGGGQGDWYDFTATADTTDGFLRRFAGHMETGAPSISDPSMSVDADAALAFTVLPSSGQSPADDRTDTYWDNDEEVLHVLELKLGERNRAVNAIAYTPGGGRIRHYAVYLSQDPEKWGWDLPVTQGEFDPENDALQVINFNETTARYIRLVAPGDADDAPWNDDADGITVRGR